jgi:competence protein ComEC
VRSDSPAAFPLIALIAGLAAGPLLVNPRFAIAGLLLIGCRASLRPALFAALGIFLALNVQSRQAREDAAFAALDPDRFAIIEAPIEGDWSERKGSFQLHTSRFRANGVEYRQPVSIYARFEPPQIAMEKSVRAEGFLRRNDRGLYTVSVKSAELMACEGRLARWHPSAWNRAMANRLERHASERPDEVALAQALALGRGERLTDEMRDSFRRGGTYHLLVFSGLQIAFAAGLLAALLRWLHKPRASDWLLMLFAVVAPLFIGPTASVSRASIGIGLYALSRLARRPTSIENLWCVAALVRLILEPRDLSDPSFHLTYAGAGALIFAGKHLAERRWLAHAVAAEVAIAPLTLFHFHQYALGGSVLTLLMSPLIFAMLIASVLACALPCTPVFDAIALLHRACTLLNAFGLSGFFTAPALPAAVGGGLLALLAIALLRKRTRAIAILAALLIPTATAVMRFVSARQAGSPRVTFFDVGQGDAIAIRSGAQTVLVDGGPDRRLLPLLADRGILRIDRVILTHAHPDHCTGLAPVIEQFDVGAVWISPRRFRGDCATLLLAACKSTSTPIHFVRDGDRIALGNVAIEVLTASRTFRKAAENNASIVLRVEAEGRRVLLTGDIEREAEIDLGDRDLRADVLKIAHHGSKSSTAASFVEQVRPRIGIISCGRRNLFGHPHPAVVEILRRQRITIWRTDESGTIDVEIRAGRLYVQRRNG